MRLTLKVLGLIWLGLFNAALAAAGGVDTVLVVSIDALHPAALSAKTTPNLHALMQSGRFTLDGRSVNPPKTLIAHTAMMTGLTPQKNGKLDNEWVSGAPRVKLPTLFDDAKRQGMHTAYYYAKSKLGYLVNAAIDDAGLEPGGGIERTLKFFGGSGPRFVFLHLSGLEYAGADSGWLSPEYLEELGRIDEELAPLFSEVRQRGRYVLVITSDHGGHERQHGTQHPEDFKLPLIVVTDATPTIRFGKGSWSIVNLRALLRNLLS